MINPCKCGGNAQCNTHTFRDNENERVTEFYYTCLKCGDGAKQNAPNKKIAEQDWNEANPLK